VLVTVGTLVERKGFHRVIDAMPRLIEWIPTLHYLVVGGAGPEGDDSAMIRARVDALGLGERVHFLGPMAPAALHEPLSAADVFVLASRYEGWANVLLEAMSCGLPVVATDVGGNAQVVPHAGLGRIVPFGEPEPLVQALHDALTRDWDRRAIRGYAASNAWEARIPQVVAVFDELLDHAAERAAGRAVGPSAPLHEVARVAVPAWAEPRAAPPATNVAPAGTDVIPVDAHDAR
jgi:glycosyltransferase involved in cell wall biosynthesis